MDLFVCEDMKEGFGFTSFSWDPCPSETTKIWGLEPLADLGIPTRLSSSSVLGPVRPPPLLLFFSKLALGVPIAFSTASRLDRTLLLKRLGAAGPVHVDTGVRAPIMGCPL
jgi:hypothetical protein